MSRFGCFYLGLVVLFLTHVIDASAQEVSFRHFNVEDGLAGNVVYTMAQDSQGFLWFGTVFGLSRFDGHEFKTYRHDPEDSTSISDNRIYEIIADKEGILWIGTEAGLNRFDTSREEFKTYRHDPEDPNSLSINDINSMLFDKEGMLWIGTLGGGLNRFNPNTEVFTRYLYDKNDSSGLSDSRVSDIIEDREGRLWIATMGGGLNLFNKETETFTYFQHQAGSSNTLQSNFINSIAIDQNNIIWIGTDIGLSTFDPSSNEFAEISLMRSSSRPFVVSDITVTRNGTLFIPTGGDGLAHYNPVADQTVWYQRQSIQRRGLPSNEVEFVFEASDGLLWVGTFNGISQMGKEDHGFQAITPESNDSGSLHVGFIRSMTWSDQALWIAGGSGLTRYDYGNQEPIAFNPSIQGKTSVLYDHIWAVLTESDGTVWLGTDNGLSHVDPQWGLIASYENDTLDESSLSNNSIRKILRDANGDLWVGTLEGGLNRLDAERGIFESYQYDPENPGGISNSEVRDILESPEGVLWIATWGGGLNRFDVDSETFTVYRHNPQDSTSLSNDVIWSIFEASDGTLWLGTDSGLNRVNNFSSEDPEEVSFTRFMDGERIETRTGVKPILQDDDGNLWLGYIGGMLARFDPDSGAYRFVMNNSVAQIGSFSDAVKDPESGTLFFGGLNGFISFNPSQLQPSNPAPDPILTSLEVFDELVLPGEDFLLSEPIYRATSVELDFDQNELTIGFIGLDYDDPNGVLYDFWLDPYDEDWRGITSQRTATYTALPPGQYTFRVRTTNRLGGRNPDVATLDIHITPPWWQTIWAYGLYGLMLLAGLFFANQMYRSRVLRAEREKIQALEIAQARELRVAYEELDKAHAYLSKEKQKTEEQAALLRELDEAKSRFFANVSHEFRTPLTLTIGPLEDLQRSGNGLIDPKAKPQIDLALRNAYRVLDLINEILDVAKLESGRLTLRAYKQDLCAFVQELAQAFMPLAERKEIDFTVEVLPRPALVVFDADQLEKVFVNLLSNAFKFTPQGGVVKMSMALDEETNPSTIQVKVRDNGQGIPREELPYVFDRFHQVDESTARLQPGTGIGLALAQQLVELHGGEIEVESEAGFGSTFMVTLKLGNDHLDKVHLAEPAESNHAPAIAGRQRAQRLLESVEALDSIGSEPVTEEDRTTVLVVEDNAEVRAYVSKHLSGRYRIIEAANGKEGLEHARKLLPDLVISDVMMPEMDGYAFCQALKSNAETAFIPVILLTARAAKEDKLEGLKDGADDYLTKPFDIQELAARVDNLISSRRRLLALADKEKPTLHATQVAVSSADEAFLEQVHACIEAHIGDEAFSVEALADEMGMDRSSLYRKMRTILGQSPADVLWTFRLERAAQLLEARAGSVSEIAYSVGFKSVAHFSRRFQKKYGVTPSKYDQITPKS